MEVGVVSMRYAKALMAYAEERGAEDRLYHELIALAHSFRIVKRSCAVLGDPIVSVDEKSSLICTAADGDNKPNEEFIRFVRLVLKEKRGAYLQFMNLIYLDLYRKKKHISVGKPITTVPVDRTTEEHIRQTAAHILHAYVELETMIGPSIEDGFVFDINDHRLDVSIATQLKKMEQQFVDKNRKIV